MATGDVQVQTAVHAVDQGRGALLIKIAMFTVLIVALCLYFLFFQFKGLSNPSAMDQAQIARNIASGKGFSTDYIRPLALSRMMERAGAKDEFDLDRFPDFSQAPLNPWVNSFALGMAKKSWRMAPSDLIYAGDRIVAGVAMVFFLLSVAVWYFVLARLFDMRLALFTCGIVLLTDLMWQFSLSGLPQMLVLFLLSLGSLATLLAMEAQQSEQSGLVIGWLVGGGVCMGLMTLAHGLAFWLFLGWVIFAGIYFRPRGLAALAALAAYLVIVTPWMVRTYQVCGNPFGLSIYEAINNGAPQDGYLRKTKITVAGSGASLKGKANTQLMSQAGRLAGLLGLNIVAAVFFLSLFHPFRNRKTFAFKWCILLMWVFAVIGMSFWPATSDVSENQMHVLFIPLFVGYGMAFLFVLWNRLELGNPLLRIAFICLLFFLCAIPMISQIAANAGSPIKVQWPPYLPPYIAAFEDWFQEDEMLGSDMPWAVSWYAHRKSLLLPETVSEFSRIHDYNVTKQRLRGLYLTPVTGNLRLFADIYKGAYKEWAGLITRPPQLRGFPLSTFAALPPEGECSIFTDFERWKKPRAAAP